MGKNGIIFGAHVSSSLHIDNKIKDILILNEGLDDTTLTREGNYRTELNGVAKIFFRWL